MPSSGSTSTPAGDRVAAETIFVVEDDQVVRRTLSKVLEASGYQVLVAATGADARAVLGQVQPDVIILDLVLPDADGLSLTASFRTLTSAPILICSGRQGQIDRELASRLGAADFLAKPFELPVRAALGAVT
ncbi:MAG: response regulator [Chloroflexota bacterium]|nr:response regulator [Chloroflexota bacterium]